jgi:O-succinylbenzoate synthase
MHIDSIQLFRVPLAHAAAPAARESIIAILRSGSHRGIGEASLAVAPLESDEWSAGALLCLRDWLAPALVGRSIDSGAALQEALAPYEGHRAAKAALDVAWWNLEATRRGQSLYALLGGHRPSVPVSQTLGVADAPEQLFPRIAAALEQGCDHVTLKLRPGWDVEMLRAVRQRFPSEPIAVDCDGHCTLAQQEMFYRLEDFFLKYIEQPLAPDDLVAHAMLQENLRTPIALDQSITSLSRLEQALDLGSCRIARIDLARVGGITPALPMQHECAHAKTVCAVGGSPQGQFAARATAAVAGLFGAALAQEAASWPAAPWSPSDRQTLIGNNAAGKLEIRVPNEVDLADRDHIEAIAGAAIEQVTLG